ncbi:MAG: RHS repeat-associated core domain-containing protein [Pirellulaceae bacterium]|nr:RHS repeat-associated core domain-containing protein [Pirellulaceae bacterium]
MPSVKSVDLESDGFGTSLSLTRTWSGMNNAGMAGNGWVDTQLPYLVVYNIVSVDPNVYQLPVIGFVQTGQNIVLFDVDVDKQNGPWASRFYLKQTLAYDSTTGYLTVTDIGGNRFVFADLPLSTSQITGGGDTGISGKLLQRFDASGFVTDYSYDTAERVQSVTETDPSSGKSHRITYTYAVVENSLGGNGNPLSRTLLSNATLSRRNSSVDPYVAVRTAVYDYYTGEGTDSDYGRLGDLKVVTIRDGSITGALIDQKYYRYYKQSGLEIVPSSFNNENNGTDPTFSPIEGDNSVWSGLKMVVENESFSRMAASIPTFLTASDEALKPFVNNFYEYERWGDYNWNFRDYGNFNFANEYHYYTRYRVTTEVSQGAGCSSCSGGLGVYKFEYHVNQDGTGLGNETFEPNVWRMRTIEYLPDTTPADLSDNDRNVVYTNEYGQIILKNVVETDNNTRIAATVSRSQSSTTVTVTTNAHGLSTGNRVAFDGAEYTYVDESGENLPTELRKMPTYSGVYTITVLNANQFSYQLPQVPNIAAVPDNSTMHWTKVDHEYRDYYRYNGAANGGFNGYGQLVLHAYPSAVNGYSESNIGLVTSSLVSTDDNEFLSNSTGKIEVYTYYDSTSTEIETTAGGVFGYPFETRIKNGELSGSSTLLTGGILTNTKNYFAKTAGAATVYRLANDTKYRNIDGTGAETTSYAYTYFTGTAEVQSITTSLPVVATNQNGPGTADVTTVFNDIYGRPIWRKDADGFIQYTQYDADSGGVTKRIQDVDTSLTGTFSGLPSGWTTPTNGGLHLTTAMVVDGLGRTTKVTDPNGNVTYTVYKDSNQEIRIYRGWNATTGTTTGPIEIQRQYRPIANAIEGERTVYNESMLLAAAPSTSGSSGALYPTGNETIVTDNIRSLSRNLTNDAGQVIQVDRYFSLAGLTYTAAIPTLGEAFYYSNYGRLHSSFVDYDGRGRLKRIQDGVGTITRILYDARNLQTQTWIGTDDEPETGYWAPNNNSEANMVLVSESQYDNDTFTGNGLLTKTIKFPGNGAANRVTEIAYDWRNRPVATKFAVDPTELVDDNTHFINYRTFDNVDRVLADMMYDGDAVSIADSNSDGVPDQPNAALLRRQITNEYDNQGRVFRTNTATVDPTTGAVSTKLLTTDTWRNRRGYVVKFDPYQTVSTGTPIEKLSYDGAGRMTLSYKVDDNSESSWSDAQSVIGDTVISQTEMTYDAAGNYIMTQHRDRFDDSSGLGQLQGPSDSTNPSRSQFSTMYYDSANRLIDMVNVGTNGGTAYSRPATVPSRSDTVLVTSTQYDDAGRLATTIDPRGIVNKKIFDMIGRTTQTIKNYHDGIPGNNENITVEFAFYGDNSQFSVNASGQTTVFSRNASTERGDAINSNSILVATSYPDKETGEASGDEAKSMTVNALGETISLTDENGSTHVYVHDVLGRIVSDTVTVLGTNVNGAIRRIGTTYNTQGLIDKITTYSDVSGSNVVTQIQRLYNGLGQMIREYQSDNGSVNTSTTPSVQYVYSLADPASSSNFSRLTSIVYPDGRVIYYSYSSSTVDQEISRLGRIYDANGDLERYDYLGLDKIIRMRNAFSGSTMRVLDYAKQTGESNGEAGDKYFGLDRFNRVVDQRWIVDGIDIDRYQYGYDRDGNRLFRDNRLSSNKSELYSYDQLNRVISTTLGTLNSTRTGTVGTVVGYHEWELDLNGNMTNFYNYGVQQERTYNKQNELIGIDNAELNYDSNGNLITSSRYDAWNRVVEQLSTTPSQIYRYDGTGRRIREGNRTIFYNDKWQAIEERITSTNTPVVQYVWSTVYIDAMIRRDRDSDNNGTLDEQLYTTYDANFNVTSLVTASGTVVQHFRYDTYGKRTILTPTWTTTTVNSYAFYHGFAGGKQDAISGRVHFRNRDYDTNLQRWITRDPIGYEGSEWNLYEYVSGNPLNRVDPNGLMDNPAVDGRSKNPFRDPPPRPSPSNSISDICKAIRASGCGGCGANCETEMQDLFDRVRNTPPRGFPNRCNNWVYDFGMNENSPCYSLQPAAWEYGAGGIPNPLSNGAGLGHVAIKVVLCDGTVFYVDSGWWGTSIGSGGGSFWSPHNTWPVFPFIP